jgi:hypothetical protein
VQAPRPASAAIAAANIVRIIFTPSRQIAADTIAARRVGITAE